MTGKPEVIERILSFLFADDSPIDFGVVSVMAIFRQLGLTNRLGNGRDMQHAINEADFLLSDGQA